MLTERKTDNRITRLFEAQKKDVLSIYVTAGFPKLEDTCRVLEALEKAGADMIEIGIPFSDPVADGETIQASNKVALDNGMSLKLLFEQLEGIRKRVSIPLLLMGYINPILQYGMEAFCKRAQEIGIDGLILPDLPIVEYREFYKETMDACGLSNILLVTPQTSESRIRMIDDSTDGFIYLVSSNAITGKTGEMSAAQKSYFERIIAMKLKNPTLIGFGISDAKTFNTACHYASGAIIGSAFIRTIANSTDLDGDIAAFVRSINKKQ